MSPVRGRCHGHCTLTASPANTIHSEISTWRGSPEKQGARATIGMFPPDPWAPEPTSFLASGGSCVGSLASAEAGTSACRARCMHCQLVQAQLTIARRDCLVICHRAIRYRPPALQRSSPGPPAFPPVLELTGGRGVLRNGTGRRVLEWFGSPRTKAYSSVALPSFPVQAGAYFRVSPSSGCSHESGFSFKRKTELLKVSKNSSVG